MKAVAEPIDAEHLELLKQALARGRSRELPRPLPKARAFAPKPPADLPRSAPEEGAAERAADRIEDREGRRRAAAAAAEAERPALPRSMDGETRERARRIGSSYIREERPFQTCPHCDAILFVTAGRCEECDRKVTAPDKVRVVFDQWPLKRLHARHIISGIQFEAGYRYYQHWYAAGLSPFGAVDFGRVSGSREPGAGMAASERQAHHRELYRIGERALGIGISAYVNAVVLQEQDPEAVGLRLTGRSAVNQARAAAIEIIRIGLDRLADAYDLVPKGRVA